MLFMHAVVAVDGTAQPIGESDLREFHPQLLGAGGSYSGVRGGLPVLFTNPAFLVNVPATITYFSLTSWAHTDIDDLFPALVQLSRGNISADSSGNGINAAIESSGIGFGSLLVTGSYGNNFGATLSFGSDFFFYGTSYPDRAFGAITNDARASFSFGYTLVGKNAPIDRDNVQFAFGLTVEPFYRTSTFLPPEQMLRFLQQHLREPMSGGASYLDAENTLYGSGVSFHGGLLLVLFKDWTIHATLRNIGDTRIFYSSTTLQTLLDEITVASLPPTARVGEAGYVGDRQFIIPAKFRFGFAWHRAFPGAVLVEPIISVELAESIITLESNPAFNPLHAFHFGGQVTLNEQFIIQLGLQQGQLTIGAGFDLGIFEIHTAWYGIARNLREKYTVSHGLAISLQFNDVVGEED